LQRFRPCQTHVTSSAKKLFLKPFFLKHEIERTPCLTDRLRGRQLSLLNKHCICFSGSQASNLGLLSARLEATKTALVNLLGVGATVQSSGNSSCAGCVFGTYTCSNRLLRRPNTQDRVGRQPV